MKSFFQALLVLYCTASLFAQNTYNGHYEINSTADYPSTALLAVELEQRFEIYNTLFRFDPSGISQLKVRFFISEAEYGAYVTARQPNKREGNGALYLHYNDPENRELVILKGEESAVSSQSFIQFLRAFIPNPPLWMIEGFAVYFNDLSFNKETKTLNYEENLSWLPTAKKQEISVEKILLTGSTGQSQTPEDDKTFQAVSWALVSFLLADTDKGYYRSLTDSFMILKPDAGSADNSEAVFNRITLFTDMKTFQADFNAYLASRKTFADLLDEGQKASAVQEYAAAAEIFRGAINQQPDRWEPYYYLGIIAYEQKDHTAAEQQYIQAQSRNADTGLIQYVRGLNAAAAGKKADAIRFLEEAAASSPDTYKTLTDDLIKKLK